MQPAIFYFELLVETNLCNGLQRARILRGYSFWATYHRILERSTVFKFLQKPCRPPYFSELLLYIIFITCFLVIQPLPEHCQYFVAKLYKLGMQAQAYSVSIICKYHSSSTSQFRSSMHRCLIRFFHFFFIKTRFLLSADLRFQHLWFNGRLESIVA